MLAPNHSSLPFHAMERNVVLRAGAGTGKTHTLVTLALHLLSGANAARKAISASKLVALTFTEKAAAELRGRIQERLGKLASGAPLEIAEPLLAKTFSALGISPPATDLWHRLRRDLALATVGTFHSFCATQLRRLAPAAGIDPAFAVLDENESRALFEEALEGHVHEALARGDGTVRSLVDAFGLSGDGELLSVARGLATRLAEDGRDASSLLDERFDAARATRAFEEATSSLRGRIRSLRTMAPRHVGKFEPVIVELERLTADLDLDNAEKQLELATLAFKGTTKPRGDEGQPVADCKEAIEAAKEALAGVRAGPLGKGLVALVADVGARYAELKSARDGLDFSDLQRLVRDVLRRDSGSRREVKERIDALLVDEFQDTSRLQLDLVALLAEKRGEEAEVTPENVAATVAWQPSLLCVVGDRKQSIYDFRGADVAVFAELERALTGPNASPPARVEVLGESRRSRPRLVRFVNELFRRAMPAATAPFEVAFGPDDALAPAVVDPEPEATAPLVELLESIGESAAGERADEAEKIAARIDRMLNDPADDVRVRGSDGKLRRPEGRDVALLYRRLTNLDVYRRALDARGLSHVVVGGGGFFDALEVLDGWMLLRTLDDPGDPVASLAVLRSPFCSLSDPTLARLALVDEGRKLAPVTLARLMREKPDLPPGEAERLGALVSFVRKLRPELDRLGLASAYARALDELDYLAVSSVLEERDAVAVNVGKLRGLLERLDAASTTARGALFELGRRIESGQRESLAAVAEESDPKSIRLMSIHQSKGLEFPVVFVVDCGAKEPVDAARVACDRDLGLALNVRFEDGRLVGMPELARVRDRRKSRMAAESLRLFYVAATRARDLLVFSGARNKGSWFEQVAGMGEAWWRRSATEVGAEEKDGLASAAARPSSDAGRSATFGAEPLSFPTASPSERRGAQGSGGEVVSPRPLPVVSVTGTVTRLQEFAQCPERYRLRHEMGLFEHSPAQLALDDEDQELDPPLDVFARGTLAHRLLELADYPREEESALRARLDALLRAEGHDPARDEIRDIREDVVAFLQSSFARELSKTEPRQRLKELPFLFALDLGDGRKLHVKGQVDLVAVTSEALRIVDYKHSRASPKAEETYRFQLASYAVAVRAVMNRPALPVEVGLAFLRDRRREPELHRLDDAALDLHEQRMHDLGRALADSYAQNRWERRERGFCDAIGCGYRPRCFGREP